jgi:hypothetical protein
LRAKPRLSWLYPPINLLCTDPMMLVGMFRHDSFTGRCLHDLGIPMYNLGHDYSAWDFAGALRLAWPSQWRRFTRELETKNRQLSCARTASC